MFHFLPLKRENGHEISWQERIRSKCVFYLNLENNIIITLESYTALESTEIQMR